MATSVVTAATDHHQTTNPSCGQAHYHDQQTKRRSSSTGRRKTKGEKIKKQPQRGMGVEKLERARLQRRWEKLTEMNAAAAYHGGGFTNINSAAAAATFSDPALFGGAASVLPVHLSKMAGYGAPIAGQMGLINPNPNHQSYNLGFHGQTTSFLQIPNNYKDQLSSSSPSSPNAVLNCYSEHCNSCRKKKKVMTRRSSEMYMMQSCDYVGDYGFLGLNIADNNNNTPQNITNYQETQHYCGLKGTKSPSSFVPQQLGYSVANSKQGVDVVAVHRRGSRSSEGVVMEYEFFPSHQKTFCSRSSDDDDNELLVMKMVGASQTMATHSSSSSSTMAAGFDASTHVDLSLKLSF